MKRVRKVTPEGMLIKMLMAQNNLTVRELGRRIGKADATICDVISGKNRSKKTLNKILEVLREDGTVDLSEYRLLFDAFLNGTETCEHAEDSGDVIMPSAEHVANDQEGNSLAAIG